MVFQCSTSALQHIGAPAKAVDQSQQCDGCGDDKLEQDGAAKVRQRGCSRQRVWDNEGEAARMRQRGRGSKGGPHLTMTSKDGVSKERIEYGRAVSNCSKELAQKSHIKKNYKHNQIKN